jgi:TPR repeat protein
MKHGLFFKKLFHTLVVANLVLGQVSALTQQIEVPPPQVKKTAAGQVSEPYLRDVEGRPEAELRRLHNEGRVDATIQMARILWANGDAHHPIALLEQPANDGIPIAQYLLGVYLRFKNRDLAGSEKWLSRAADAGHPIAQEYLAGLLQFGRAGFPKDEERAFRLYLAAARQGLIHSQMNVGMMLCTGTGVAVNREQGKVWFLNSQLRQLKPFTLKDAGCE